MQVSDNYRPKGSFCIEPMVSDEYVGIPTQVIIEAVDKDGNVVDAKDLGHNYILYGMSKWLSGMFVASALRACDPSDVCPIRHWSSLFPVDLAHAEDLAGAICLAVGAGNPSWTPTAPPSESEANPLLSYADSVCYTYYPTRWPSPAGVPPRAHSYCRKRLENEIARKPFNSCGIQFLKWDLSEAHLGYIPLDPSDSSDVTIRPVAQLETTINFADVSSSPTGVVSIMEMGIFGGWTDNGGGSPLIYNPSNTRDADYQNGDPRGGIMFNWKVFAQWNITPELSFRIIWRFFF